MPSRMPDCDRFFSPHDTSNRTDTDLVLEIQKDDKGAYAELVRRHLNSVWRLARNMLCDDGDAEDIAQEVFLTVWRARHNWRPEGAQFSTWIYRIAINKCIDFKRKKRSENGELAEEIIDPKAPNAQADLEKREQGKILSRAIAELPETQRLAIVLYYYDEQNVDEIAQTLNNTEQGVRSLLKRGRQNLRRQMQIQKDLCNDAGTAERTDRDIRSRSLPVAL